MPENSNYILINFDPFKVELHSMFKAFLTCANTRESILEYIAAVILKNMKLAQLQADHDKLAGSSPLVTFRD